jgi:hypothetical protein
MSIALSVYIGLLLAVIIGKYVKSPELQGAK